MSATEKYDLFISYRRDGGGEYARMLYMAFKIHGFLTFFDFTSLKSGRFNENIFKAIDSCRYFILVLTDGALDRCMEEGDWVRKEIEYALSRNKVIVPVAPSGNARNFPEVMPETFNVLRTIQISKLDLDDLFDASIEKIIHDRLERESVEDMLTDDENLLDTWDSFTGNLRRAAEKLDTLLSTWRAKEIQLATIVELKRKEIASFAEKRGKLNLESTEISVKRSSLEGELSQYENKVHEKDKLMSLQSSIQVDAEVIYAQICRFHAFSLTQPTIDDMMASPSSGDVATIRDWESLAQKVLQNLSSGQADLSISEDGTVTTNCAPGGLLKERDATRLVNLSLALSGAVQNNFGTLFITESMLPVDDELLPHVLDVCDAFSREHPEVTVIFATEKTGVSNRYPQCPGDLPPDR